MGAMKRPAAAMKKVSTGGKRAAKRSTEPAQKKPKVDPFRRDYDQVCRGVGMDAELPFNVKEMLQAMVPACLNLNKEDRHKYQNDVVDMIEGVLVKIEREMLTESQDCQKQIMGLGEERAKREGATKEAQENYSAKEARKAQEKEALAEAGRALQDAKAALATAQKEQKEGDKDLLSASDRLAKIKTCLTELIEPLAEGSVPQANQKKTISSLVQILETFGYDKSLTTSLPASISRAPAERGQFDHTVIQQLRNETATRTAELQNVIDEGAAAKASRAAKVEAAEAALAAATGKHAAQSEAFAAAEAEVEAQNNELKRRIAELDNLEPEANKLKKREETLAKRISSFRDGPLGHFRRLAQRTAPAAAVEEEAPAAPAAPVSDAA